ncbi:MAG: hypothetical protein UHS41_06540 [Lachnospiraceae bacterium]|nr:hypothetical protein [Lachnospiraceae bacterium]
MNEELCKYLSDEYMICVEKEEELVSRKFILQAEQRKVEENLYFHVEEERTRQLFTPLTLKGYDYARELTQENLDLSNADAKLKACEEELGQIEEKKKKLKEFMNSLREISCQLEEKEKKDKIPFFPAFYELVEHTKSSFPDTEFLYDEDEAKPDCYMTFDFLTRWKYLFRYLSDHLLISDILFRVFDDEDKVVMVMECVSETALEEQEKVGLEDILSKEFFIQSWKEDSFEIHMILD